MINNISSSSNLQMLQSSSSAKAMTTEQSDSVKEILSQFDPENITQEDALSIQNSLNEAGITPSKELSDIMAELDFDANSIGDVGKPEGQRPPPPPSESSLEQVDTEEVISYLDELLQQYSDQLDSEDKESILASVQEKFGLSEGESLLSVTA